MFEVNRLGQTALASKGPQTHKLTQLEESHIYASHIHRFFPKQDSTVGPHNAYLSNSVEVHFLYCKFCLLLFTLKQTKLCDQRAETAQIPVKCLKMHESAPSLTRCFDGKFHAGVRDTGSE